MRNSTSKDEAQDQVVEAILSDMADLGLQIGSESDPSLLHTTLERLCGDHDFPKVRQLAKQLVAQAVQNAAILMSRMPCSSSISREDSGQLDYWEEYKFRIRKGNDIHRDEELRNFIRFCCFEAAAALIREQKRLIQTCILNENVGNARKAHTMPELIFVELEKLASVENLDQNPEVEDEVPEDENGEPLWKLRTSDESCFQLLVSFLESRYAFESDDPQIICILAIAANFIRRLPRRSSQPCGLSINYRFERGFSCISLQGDENSFTLSRYGNEEGAFPSEIMFARSSDGDSNIGDATDVSQWIQAGKELIGLGATIGSDEESLEDILWDDGDSYWDLLRE